MLCGVARHPQHPFSIERRGDASRARRQVFQTQVHHLDRRIRGDKEPQALGKPVTVVLENRIASAMANQVRRGRAARQRRGRPDFGGFFVAQVERLAWRIGDGIVGPRREPVFAAVAKPSIACASFGHRETKIGIGNDIDPRRRRPPSRLQVNDILAPILAKSPPSVVKAKIVGTRQRRRGFQR